MKNPNLILAIVVLLAACNKEDAVSPDSIWASGLSRDFPGTFVFTEKQIVQHDSPNNISHDHREIFTLDAKGTHQLTSTCQVICNNEVDGCNRYSPKWLNDKRVIFNNQSRSGYVLVDSLTGIYSISPDGNEYGTVVNTHVDAFDVSGNGVLAVVKNDTIFMYGVRDDALADLLDVTVMPSTGGASSFFYLTLSPSGEKIAIFRGSGGFYSLDMELLLYEFIQNGLSLIKNMVIQGGSYDENSNPYQADIDHRGYIEPSWSHKSDKLAFIKEGDVFTVNANGSELWNLTKTHSEFEYSPQWSPVNDSLVFIIGLVPYSRLGLMYQFNSYDADYFMHPDINHIFHLRWSSDGQSIAFNGFKEEAKKFQAYNPWTGTYETEYTLEGIDGGLMIMHKDGTGLIRISEKGKPDFAWYTGN